MNPVISNWTATTTFNVWLRISNLSILPDFLSVRPCHGLTSTSLPPQPPPIFSPTPSTTTTTAKNIPGTTIFILGSTPSWPACLSSILWLVVYRRCTTMWCNWSRHLSRWLVMKMRWAISRLDGTSIISSICPRSTHDLKLSLLNLTGKLIFQVIENMQPFKQKNTWAHWNMVKI